ncbi:MAG: transporter [Bacilli bacterium]|nr:transporter [Bacilli bacterium]
MRQFRKLFDAHLKSTFREKQVWFWAVFYPVLLLVIFLMIFGGSDAKESNFTAKVVAVSEQQAPISTQLLTVLQSIPALEWKNKQPVSRAQAEEWVKKKDIDAAIVLPTDDISKPMELIINKEKQNSALTQAMNSIVSGALQKVSQGDAPQKPQYSIQTNFISSGSAKLKYVDFLLTGLIALSISQAGLFGMIMLVEMRRNGLLKRLMLSPVNMKLFGLSNMMVRFILSAIQAVLLTLIGILFYHASVDINVIAFLLVFIVGTISFSAIGFMISSLSKTPDSYFGFANLFSFVMMFLSGIFFDSSSLPSYIKPISNILPLTYFANGIRDGMVYGLGVMHSALWIDLGVLAAWGLAAFVIGSRFYKWKG